MQQAVALIRTILGTAQDAEQVFHEALCAEVDPLRWCAMRFGIDEAEVMRRAARFAGLEFRDTIPPSLLAGVRPDSVDHLHEIRIVRPGPPHQRLSFAAPDFYGVLRLARSRLADPAPTSRICLVPPRALRDFLLAATEDRLLDEARQRLTRRWPGAVAQLELTRTLRWCVALFLFVFAMLMVLAPLLELYWLMPIWAVLVVAPSLVRMQALLEPAPQNDVSPPRVADSDLPHYTILIPMHDEANMVDQICQSLRRLNYPPERLDIMFVVERKSTATLRAVERHLGDMRFSLVSVPDSMPRTKPKALNFALPLCRGEILVVFDAEDRPEPDHLRQAVACFRANPEVDCVQARLLITNGDKGWLPALFAGEYAALFTVWLPALANWGLVAPLGGTSNHFRLEALRAIGGWDSYNVTEDADLGVRLARRRRRTMVCPAVTWEDAPRDLNVWMRQRTRWMKGWIQTMVVHNRRFPELVADLGWVQTLLFQIVVIGMIFSPVLHAGFLVCMGIKLALEIPLLPAFGVWSAMCGVVLAFGYGVAFIHTILGLRRSGQLALLRYQPLVLVYWLLIGWATLRALIEFAHNPFHWHKTPHQISADRKALERVKGIEPSS